MSENHVRKQSLNYEDDDEEEEVDHGEEQRLIVDRQLPIAKHFGFRRESGTVLVAPSTSEDGLPKSVLIRNLVAFWFLGLCNNYAYCIMLSAAHDVLDEQDPNAQKNSSSVFLPERDCNPISTGREVLVQMTSFSGGGLMTSFAILLANILPALCIKIVAPFILSYTVLQIAFTIVLAIASFLVVAFSTADWMTFTGVACASLSSGLGEVTLLRFSTAYTKNTVSTWSSGTGASGVLGSFSYASITTAGLSPRDTLLLMITVPCLMAVVFFIVLVHPSKMNKMRQKLKSSSEVNTAPSDNDDMIKNRSPPLSFRTKLFLILPLLKYMIPLSLVYLAEYFINQGLTELIFFKNTWMTHDEQYRWFQVLYQVGVFISRSSVNVVKFDKLWIFAILQMVNATFFLFEAYYLFLPSIWIVFALILYEGLLGGCSYVNTFYKITQEVQEPHREFSMGAASFGDSLGITVAGFISIPVHDLLCSTPIPT